MGVARTATRQLTERLPEAVAAACVETAGCLPLIASTADLAACAEWPVWRTRDRQYATPIAFLRVAGLFSAASMAWAASAREIV